MTFKRPFWLGLIASVVLALVGFAGVILTEKHKGLVEEIGLVSAVAMGLGELAFICLIVWAFIMIVISRIRSRQKL